jgi:ribonuclease P protein component
MRGGGVGQALPRPERLSAGDEFREVFRRGARFERGSVVVLWLPAPGERKAGFTVSRQIRGAVRRNRARRRVREAYRTSREALPGGVRLVVVARPRAVTAPYHEVLAEVREALGVIRSRWERGGRG